MNSIISGKDEQKRQKWYEGYIEDINLNNIEWRRFNSHELTVFLHQNYWDEEYESFVMFRNESNSFSPFGMNYLTFTNEGRNVEYLVGFAPNKCGTRTIVACMTIIPKFLLERNSIKPVTYIRNIDINRYITNQEIILQMIESLSILIDLENYIVIDNDMIPKPFIEFIKRILVKQGFEGDVRDKDEIDYDYLYRLKKKFVKRKGYNDRYR